MFLNPNLHELRASDAETRSVCVATGDPDGVGVRYRQVDFSQILIFEYRVNIIQAHFLETCARRQILNCTLRLTLFNKCPHRQQESHPSFDHACRNAAALLYISLDVRHPRGAARAAQKHRRRPRVLLTAYAPRCSRSTLDTLERCQRLPRSANPTDLWLVLDATSAGSESTVVLNVIVTHSRSRNTCNLKAVK